MYKFFHYRSYYPEKQSYSHFLDNVKILIFDEQDNNVLTLETKDLKNLFLALGHPASELVKDLEIEEEEM